MDDETLRKDKDKVLFSKAIARVLEIAEDEGYSEGWDTGMDIGYQSGAMDAAHKFVEALCRANDKYTAETYEVEKDGKEQNEHYDSTVGRLLSILEDELPFYVDWTNCVPIFPHEIEDDDESEDDAEV